MEQNSDQLNIDTPELVAIQMPLAGIGSRFIALLIDTLIWVAADPGAGADVLAPGSRHYCVFKGFSAMGRSHLRARPFSTQLGLLHPV